MRRRDPSRTALADLVRGHLRQHGMTLRQAAQQSGLPVATLHAVIDRPGAVVTSKTRAGLVRLGLPASTVEHAAANAAGFHVAPEVLTVKEWQTVRYLRALPPPVAEATHGYLAAFSQPWLVSRDDVAQPETT